MHTKNVNKKAGLHANHTPRAPTQFVYIYNNIKRIDCQALQSLQTLTKTSCEQKENFNFRHALFTQKSRFMQLVKFPFNTSMQGKLYLPLFFDFSSIYRRFDVFL
jgi:hypothetical protein